MPTEPRADSETRFLDWEKRQKARFRTKSDSRPVIAPARASAMASIAAAGVAAAAIGAWYTQRKTPALSDFTEPPKTWGESVVRLHEVVRISWKEALSKLGIWRLDHLLAIRHLSSRDMSDDIAEDISRLGTKVTFSEEWHERLRFIDLAMRYNRLLRGARSVEQIEQKLASMGSTSVTGNAEDAEPRATILLSQLRPAILKPAYILVKDKHAKQLFFVVRGTHSVRDTVTSLTAHSKPHHLVDATSGAVVLGRAHAGFLSTARWLAKIIKPDLASALENNPGFELTIVGHSLGAGVAVVLTQTLRELEGGDKSRNAFADTKCLAFACPSALSKELSESCKPFVTTVVCGADIVPTVSFSKVSELQQQIVSAAWEQQVLKKWRETTRAMAAACAAPRRDGSGTRGKDAGGASDALSDAPGPTTGVIDSYASSLLGRVPGALTCGFGGRRRDPETSGSERNPTTAEEAVVSGMRVVRSPNAGATSGNDDDIDRDAFSFSAESVDSAVDRLAHLPGAAARGGGVRPRRWLGAQMRSLRRNLGAPLAVPEMAHTAGSGNKLTRLASIGGALLAGCVAPRQRSAAETTADRERGERGVFATGNKSAFSPTRADSPEPSSTRRTNSFGAFVGRASPTLAAAAAAEAARGTSLATSATSASEAALRREKEKEDSALRDSLLVDDDLDLDAHASLGDLSSSRMLERLEGEAAQEVLKLQEELSVIQAADGAEDFDGLLSAETFETFEPFGRSDGKHEGRNDFSADGGARAPLPAPRTTTSDPVALLGPGAPEAIREAARTADRSLDDDLAEPEESVDYETLAARVATGKGGSNWSSAPRSSTEKDKKEIKEDADAFAVKLYPAGRILHMVLVPSDDAEEDVLKDKGEEIREELEPGASAKENENRTQAKRYELYADVSVEAYDRIRLSKTMLSDHFLPKYIEALEDVRARLEAEKKSGTKTETGLL